MIYQSLGTETHIMCCDWGTSSFRLRLVDTDTYDVLAEYQSGDGIASTFREWQENPSEDRFKFYSAKLNSAVQKLAVRYSNLMFDVPILVSGMASSSIGMEEIPYALLPFPADGSQASVKITPDFTGAGKPLVVVSGVRSDEDVMRGEEAQLIGLITLKEVAGFDKDNALYVFPGTHSKHIEVQDSTISAFKTYMTGEIFQVLSQHSILKDSINAGADISVGENTEAFEMGVEASGDDHLLHNLFTIRTNQLFHKFSKEQNYLYLSGLLIGSEVRQLQKYSGQVVICCGSHLFKHYHLASNTLGLSDTALFIEPAVIDKATIAGQVQIFKATYQYE